MGKTRILESDENNENYYELEKKASEMMPSKETLPTKISVTKLPTTHKDYNLKELHLADRDLYKSLLKVIQGVLNVEFVDTVGIKIYSTTKTLYLLYVVFTLQMIKQLIL